MNGDTLDEKATEEMSKNKHERPAFDLGWKMDKDGWYIKKIEPANRDKVKEFLTLENRRCFLADNGTATFGEVKDCLAFEKFLQEQK